MRIFVTLSGGLDSSTLAAWLVHTGHEVHGIGINYGQRHAAELEYARRMADALGIPFTRVDVPLLAQVLGGSSQTDPGVRVPHGHYADASMRTTVVPNRNMILLAIAAGCAVAKRCDGIAIANHAGDHAVYPDCRAEFVERMRAVLEVANYEPVQLLAPFTMLDKADIVKLAEKLRVPLHLAFSCYEGRDGGGHALHCGQCGTCVERAEAFRLAGVPDPTTYAHLDPKLRRVEPRGEFKTPARIPE